MLNGASILVTGGTGSFGKAFLSKALRENPHRLVILSRDEMKQDALAREFDHPSLRWFVGDVRDQSRLEMAMRGIDIVIHAAAMKIIPKCETDPMECIATNIGGAQNVVRAAMRAGVKKVVALSTDKACEPLNVYGASKLAAEKLFVASNNLSGSDGPKFSVVRYGNVVGSRGSVIPLWKSLAEQGLPLPITDPDMTRFWITLDEAVQLVMDALETMQGREIFVPRIPSMKVTDLADAIAPDLPRKFIGIRPGEKLHEVLLTREESRHAIKLPNKYIIEEGTGGDLPLGFSYSSDRNDHWLTRDQLKRIAGLGDVPEEMVNA